MRRRRFLGSAGLLAAPLLAGCSGDDGGDDGNGGDGGGAGDGPTATETATRTETQTSTEAQTATATETETATDTETRTETATEANRSAREEYPDFDWDDLEGVEPVATSEIRMEGFEFHPQSAAVTPGTEVTVHNRDSASHTITVPRLGIDETLSAGGSTSFTVEEERTVEFVCRFHPPDMLGRLVVTSDPPTATATETETQTESDDGGGGYGY